MGTTGQDGGYQGLQDIGLAPWPSQLPGSATYTIQAAGGAQCVQHLLTPLGEAILGPGDAL